MEKKNFSSNFESTIFGSVFAHFDSLPTDEFPLNSFFLVALVIVFQVGHVKNVTSF